MNELYLKYKEAGVFRKERVKKDFPHLSANAINVKLFEAKRSRVIKSITGRRGIYYVVPPGENYNRFKVDPFLLASNIAPGALICYASALAALGKSHSVLNVMYVSTESPFRDLDYQDVRYKFVVLPKRKLHLRLLFYKGHPVRVTSIERTLVDCLRCMKYAGGFEQLYRSFEGVAYLNWKKLQLYLKGFPSPLVVARVGFFVELFKDRWRFPDSFFSRLEKKKPRYPDYFIGRDSKSGILIKRWNLIVPEEILSLGGYGGRSTVG